jgi:hypothetical protein
MIDYKQIEIGEIVEAVCDGFMIGLPPKPVKNDTILPDGTMLQAGQVPPDQRKKVYLKGDLFKVVLRSSNGVIVEDRAKKKIAFDLKVGADMLDKTPWKGDFPSVKECAAWAAEKRELQTA